MTNDQIIRAWKDPAYRASLSDAERAALPAHPAGGVEISDADLGKVVGGRVSLGRAVNEGPVVKDSDFCSLACPTHVLCTLNDCSQLGCATAYPNCPIGGLARTK
jgi:mersacidin/lichenicidin family type 2 lantibiotic